MQKEFVPYDLALKLKELGFDEACLASSSPNYECYIPSKGGIYKNSKDFKNSDYAIACPTFGQAFKFFRDKYKLFYHIMSIDPAREDVYWKYIIFGKTPNRRDVRVQAFSSYEKAELECLKQLIKIVKDEK